MSCRDGVGIRSTIYIYRMFFISVSPFIGPSPYSTYIHHLTSPYYKISIHPPARLKMHTPIQPASYREETCYCSAAAAAAAVVIVLVGYSYLIVAFANSATAFSPYASSCAPRASSRTQSRRLLLVGGDEKKQNQKGKKKKKARLAPSPSIDRTSLIIQGKLRITYA